MIFRFRMQEPIRMQFQLGGAAPAPEPATSFPSITDDFHRVEENMLMGTVTDEWEFAADSSEDFIPVPTPPPDLMPVVTDVTGYFDQQYGVTSSEWENQIGEENITFTGTVTKQTDCVRIAASSNGVFNSGVLPSAFTIYLVARAEKTSTWRSGRGQFLLSGITTNYGMTGIEISTGWDQRSRAAFRSINGVNVDTRVPGNEFHVYAVSVSNGTMRCFCDGTFLGSGTYRANTLSHIWLNQREGNVVNRYYSDYQFFAYATSNHSDSEIAQNSAWLVQRFGVVPFTAYSLYNYISATGTQYIDTGYEQQSDEMMFRTQIYVNSPPSSTVPIINAGENFMVAIMYKSSSYSDAMYKGGSDVVNAEENSLPNQSVTNVYLHVSTYDTQFGVGSTYPYGQSVDASTLTSGNYQLLAEGFNGSIYATLIADGEVIVRDFVPARRTSDGKVGMYDMVTHNFFTSAGSGDFTL